MMLRRVLFLTWCTSCTGTWLDERPVNVNVLFSFPSSSWILTPFSVPPFISFPITRRRRGYSRFYSSSSTISSWNCLSQCVWHILDDWPCDSRLTLFFAARFPVNFQTHAERKDKFVQMGELSDFTQKEVSHPEWKEMYFMYEFRPEAVWESKRQTVKTFFLTFLLLPLPMSCKSSTSSSSFPEKRRTGGSVIQD